MRGRNDSSNEAMTQAVLDYPRAAGVVAMRPLGPQGDALVFTGGRHFRVSSGMAAALAKMDGTRSLTELGECLRLSPDRVTGLVAHLDGLGLLARPSRSSYRGPRRVVDIGLPAWLSRVLLANIDLADPHRLVAWLFRILRLDALYGYRGIGVFVTLVALGTAAAFVQLDTLRRVLAGGVDPMWLWTIPAAAIAKHLVHETGHAFACYHFTRRVGRLGVGLYFFLPALYVDVSSAWIISEPAVAGLGTRGRAAGGNLVAVHGAARPECLPAPPGSAGVHRRVGCGRRGVGAVEHEPAFEARRLLHSVRCA